MSCLFCDRDNETVRYRLIYDHFEDRFLLVPVCNFCYRLRFSRRREAK